MQKKAAKKVNPAEPIKEKKKQKISAKKAPLPEPLNKGIKNSSSKRTRPAVSKAAAAVIKKESNKPGLRSVYSNSRHTLLPLGFATDFKTKKQVVIFSDLSTGQVHTVALSVWNRWKMKEVKKLNTET